jgi:predicted DNA-binding protein
MSGRMAQPSQRKPRRPGRPPGGTQAGEKVRDYPQLSIRVPEEAKLKLGALSVVRAKPQWRVVLESIDCLIQSLSESDQHLVQELIKRPADDRKSRLRRQK